MAHMWRRHVTHTNSFIWLIHMYDLTSSWVMAHMWRRHVKSMNLWRDSFTCMTWLHIWMSEEKSGVMSHMWGEWWHSYQADSSRIWRSEVIHVDESCHAYKVVVSNVSKSHATRVKQWSHVWSMLRNAILRVTALIHMQCALRCWAQSTIANSIQMWHAPFPCVAWLIYMQCARQHSVQSTRTNSTWLIENATFPKNPETQIPRYELKLNQNLILNLNLYYEYREIWISRYGVVGRWACWLETMRNQRARNRCRCVP